MDLGPWLRRSVNAGLDWLLAANPDGIEAFGRGLAWPAQALERLLVAAPSWLLLGLVAALAWRLTRNLRFALAMTGLLGFVLALGLWAEAMRTLALAIVAVSIAFAVGLPLGILGARKRRLGEGLRTLYDLMQTIPSFVYLIPAAMLMGLGTAPALLATIVVALPPVARLADLGLRQVGEGERDAARALGLTRRQRLFLVELPLAWPTVMAGVNQAVMAALGMVVVASMIGARGLGETVLLGLQRADAGQGVVGGAAIVALAVVVDRMTQAAGRPRWPAAAIGRL
jgi:ABC-type proline/glycine betaine transport system permease subunit